MDQTIFSFYISAMTIRKIMKSIFMYYFTLGSEVGWLDDITGCQGECDLKDTWVTYSDFEWYPK